MRKNGASGVAAFILLVMTGGCSSTPVAQQPPPAPVSPAPPVTVTATTVPITITSGGLEVISVNSKTDMLEFQTTAGDDGGFTVNFPKNVTKYPSACAPPTPTTPPASFNVCPGAPVSCPVNPAVATGAVYYKIKGGLSCQAKKPGPIPYSVVHCPHC
jgi:hypothetical protein